MTYTFFIGGLTGGGSERVLCNLANYLVEKGACVEIVTMSETASYHLHPNISHKILLKNNERSNIIINTYKRFTRLIQYVKNRVCDAYVVMLPMTTILLLCLKKYIKAPIIASERAFPPKYSFVIRSLLAKVAKRAAGWVFQTPTVQDWYNQYLGKSRAIVIPNAVNRDFTKSQYTGARNNEIVSIGRLSPQKRFDLLITAFSKIAPKYPNLKLVIYGQGACLEQLQDVALNCNVQDRVFFPGYDNNIPEKIEKSRLFVLSSEFEGIPNVLIEAMALGIPCVATDCDGGGAKMLINDEVNGLLIPKNNLDAMVDAMDKVLSDKALAEKLSQNAIRIREEYAPEVIYEKWEKFINDIISESSNA